MARPTAIFLDTSILGGQQYNFTSTAIASFVEAMRKHQPKLLLPKPTDREILRHLMERSTAAVDVFAEARRKAPFLAKLKHFSQLPDQRVLEFDAHRLA